MAEKKVKYYNPYPFPIRVINDLGKEQVFAPQGHGKVLKNRYTQSKIELPVWSKKSEKIYRTDLDLDLDKMLKSGLIDLAWTVMIADKSELDGMTKREITKAIRDKVGPEEVPEEDKPEEEAPDDDETSKDVKERLEIQIDVAEEQEDSEEESEKLETESYEEPVNTETHGD